jgi:homoaconitase/3-isopropylmalate dehydratase large subunit
MMEDTPNGDTHRVSVVRDDNKNVIVIEHDLPTGKSRKSATFHKEERKGVDENGKEVVVDVAKLRALVYAQLFEELVNSGQVYLGNLE